MRQAHASLSTARRQFVNTMFIVIKAKLTCPLFPKLKCPHSVRGGVRSLRPPRVETVSSQETLSQHPVVPALDVEELLGCFGKPLG